MKFSQPFELNFRDQKTKPFPGIIATGTRCVLKLPDSKAWELNLKGYAAILWTPPK